MYPWWPTIEVDGGPGFMTDPGLPDPRIPVYFDGRPGLDGETLHLRPAKVHGSGRRHPAGALRSHAPFVLAEALFHQQDYSGATAILYALRAAVGLPGYATPTGFPGMEEIILRVSALPNSFWRGFGWLTFTAWD